jgi:hypothetical protein
MWDWETPDFKGSIRRPNLPCVFRCGEINDHAIGHYVRLTEEWQFFWFDLCCKIYYGKYHQDLTADEREWFGSKWTSVGDTTTAFTNQHGLDRFRNYILKNRLGAQDPKIYTLVCGGASLAGTPVEYKKGKKSVWMLRVAHFDGNRPPPPVETIDPYTDPRVFFANTIRNKRIRGTYCIKVFEEGNPLKPIVREIEHGYSVNRFPQFHRDGQLYDCPVPLVATEDIYFPMKYLVPISAGAKIFPYFPD